MRLKALLVPIPTLSRVLSSYTLLVSQAKVDIFGGWGGGGWASIKPHFAKKCIFKNGLKMTRLLFILYQYFGGNGSKPKEKALCFVIR